MLFRMPYLTSLVAERFSLFGSLATRDRKYPPWVGIQPTVTAMLRC
jgi:hypothetical protein